MKREDFTVRDRRRPGHHWADNEIIDDFGPRIGAYGYAVYMFICRYAGNDNGRCCKTQKEIAAAFSISHDTVKRAAEKLEECGLITVENLAGEPSVYYIGLVSKRPYAHSVYHPTLLASTPTPTASTPTLLASCNKEERLSLNSIKTKPPTPFGENQSPSAQDQNPETFELDIYSAARGLGEKIGMGHSGGKGLHKLTSAIQQAQRRWPDKRIEQVVDDIVTLWKEYLAQGHHAPVALHNWLETVGRFIDSDDWKKKPASEKYPVDEHGGHFEGSIYVTKDGKRMPGYKPMPLRKPEIVR